MNQNTWVRFGKGFVGGVTILSLAVVLMGCQGLFIGRALSEVKGGEPQLSIIRNPAPDALLGYRNVKVEKVTNEMGPVLPPYAGATIREEFIKEITKKPALFSLRPGSPRTTLIVRASIIHYQTAGSLSKVMGGFNLLICRVRLIDGATGKVIGEANCGGVSKAIARSGINELADATGKALRKWLTLKGHYPQDEEE